MLSYRAALIGETQEIEGMNSTFQVMCKRAPSISLQLASDRLNLKHGRHISPDECVSLDGDVKRLQAAAGNANRFAPVTGEQRDALKAVPPLAPIADGSPAADSGVGRCLCHLPKGWKAAAPLVGITSRSLSLYAGRVHVFTVGSVPVGTNRSAAQPGDVCFVAAMKHYSLVYCAMGSFFMEADMLMFKLTTPLVFHTTLELLSAEVRKCPTPAVAPVPEGPPRRGRKRLPRDSVTISSYLVSWQTLRVAKVHLDDVETKVHMHIWLYDGCKSKTYIHIC
jgi:hypothetical protein